MQVSINFRKKEIIFIGDGTWEEFAQVISALEMIDSGNELSWKVKFQTGITEVRDGQPLTVPYFINPADLYKHPTTFPDWSRTYCGDGMATLTVTNDNVTTQ